MYINKNLREAAKTPSHTGLSSNIEKSQIHNLTLYLNKLGKEEQMKANILGGKKKIPKIRVEINGIENKKTKEKIKDTKSWFLEVINKMDKYLTRLIQKKRGSKK